MDFKIFILSFCLLFGVFGHPLLANPVQKNSTLSKGVGAEVNKSESLEYKLYRGDFIPSLPNPFHLNETSHSVDSETVKGTLSLSNTVATGLNSLTDDLNINLVTRKASATLKIPSTVTITGDYNLDATVNPTEEESTSVAGNGPFTITLNNMYLLLDAKLDVGLLSGKVSIATLDIQVSYDSIAINAEGFTLNDETVDWESVNSELNDNFESVWSQYQEPLTLAVMEGFNELLSETTLSDFVDVFQGKKTFDQLIKT